MLKRIAPEITFHSSSELQALCIITHLLYYTTKYKKYTNNHFILPQNSKHPGSSPCPPPPDLSLQRDEPRSFNARRSVSFPFSLCYLCVSIGFFERCYRIHILIMIMSEACNELSDPSYFPDCQLCICRRNIVMCTDWTFVEEILIAHLWRKYISQFSSLHEYCCSKWPIIRFPICRAYVGKLGASWWYYHHRDHRDRLSHAHWNMRCYDHWPIIKCHLNTLPVNLRNDTWVGWFSVLTQYCTAMC